MPSRKYFFVSEFYAAKYMEINAEVFQGHAFCAQTAKTFHISTGLLIFCL